ncbi:MAG: hypothetical protein WCH99_09985 [Verrucomicrobiota bacterium]
MEIRDQQLADIDQRSVLEKRRADQGLNAKEFAIAAGLSYSAARDLFRQPGFPVIKNVCFWSDFEFWRRSRITSPPKEAEPTNGATPHHPKPVNGLPRRAQQILQDARK